MCVIYGQKSNSLDAEKQLLVLPSKCHLPHCIILAFLLYNFGAILYLGRKHKIVVKLVFGPIRKHKDIVKLMLLPTLIMNKKSIH